MKTALVAGATGLTGHELVQQLMNDPWYHKVIILVRKKTGLSDAKLEEIVVDFDHLSEHAGIISKANHVFCCLGTTIKTAGSKEAFRKVDHDFPVALAKLCQFTDVTHFMMISAMGANPASSIFYNRVKGETEKDISIMKIPAITFFRPSLLLGDRKEARSGEQAAVVLSNALSFLMKGPLKNYKPIKVEDVAAAMIKEAKKENRAGVRVVISGEMQGMYLRRKLNSTARSQKFAIPRFMAHKIPTDE